VVEIVAVESGEGSWLPFIGADGRGGGPVR
jgi:hypothetical protein